MEAQALHTRQGAASVSSAFQPSGSFPIPLASWKAHTMHFEGQYPISIMLNRTWFHAEKSTHLQT